MIPIEQYLSARQVLVEQALERQLPATDTVFSNLVNAMRYSLFVGGKRVRPILCLAAAEAVSDAPNLLEKVMPTACALECIHTYSLIHDDLPAMDDDELRRGKPTCHKVYGEAAAILAGDGLLTYAFELLSSQNDLLSSQQRLKICHLIAQASGPAGMVGGQALDIANENREFPFELLQTIHRSKTGALISCSIQVGAVAAGANAEQEEHLLHYGSLLGLAFQIVDDLLDVTATTEQLGKTAGSDKKNGKATYPAYFGIEKTRKIALETIEAAKGALTIFDHKAAPLRDLADYIYSRTS